MWILLGSDFYFLHLFYWFSVTAIKVWVTFVIKIKIKLQNVQHKDEKKVIGVFFLRIYFI